MTELRQNIWTVSTPVSAEVHNALQESSGLEKKTGEQNVDMSVAKMSQDWKDTNTVYEFLDERKLCVIQCKPYIKVLKGPSNVVFCIRLTLYRVFYL